MHFGDVVQGAMKQEQTSGPKGLASRRHSVQTMVQPSSPAGAGSPNSRRASLPPSLFAGGSQAVQSDKVVTGGVGSLMENSIARGAMRLENGFRDELHMDASMEKLQLAHDEAYKAMQTTGHVNLFEPQNDLELFRWMPDLQGPKMERKKQYTPWPLLRMTADCGPWGWRDSNPSMNKDKKEFLLWSLQTLPPDQLESLLMRLQGVIVKQEQRCQKFDSVLSTLLEDVQRAQGYDVVDGTEVAAFTDSQSSPLLASYNQRRAEFLERTATAAPDPEVIDITKKSLREFVSAHKDFVKTDGASLLEKFWSRMKREEQDEVALEMALAEEKGTEKGDVAEPVGEVPDEEVLKAEAEYRMKMSTKFGQDFSSPGMLLDFLKDHGDNKRYAKYLAMTGEEEVLRARSKKKKHESSTSEKQSSPRRETKEESKHHSKHHSKEAPKRSKRSGSLPDLETAGDIQALFDREESKDTSKKHDDRHSSKREDKHHSKKEDKHHGDSSHHEDDKHSSKKEHKHHGDDSHSKPKGGSELWSPGRKALATSSLTTAAMAAVLVTKSQPLHKHHGHGGQDSPRSPGRKHRQDDRHPELESPGRKHRHDDRHPELESPGRKHRHDDRHPEVESGQRHQHESHHEVHRKRLHKDGTLIQEIARTSISKSQPLEAFEHLSKKPGDSTKDDGSIPKDSQKDSKKNRHESSPREHKDDESIPKDSQKDSKKNRHESSPREHKAKQHSKRRASLEDGRKDRQQDENSPRSEAEYRMKMSTRFGQDFSSPRMLLDFLKDHGDNKRYAKYLAMTGEQSLHSDAHGSGSPQTHSPRASGKAKSEHSHGASGEAKSERTGERLRMESHKAKQAAQPSSKEMPASPISSPRRGGISDLRSFADLEKTGLPSAKEPQSPRKNSSISSPRRGGVTDLRSVADLGKIGTPSAKELLAQSPKNSPTASPRRGGITAADLGNTEFKSIRPSRISKHSMRSV